MDLSILSTEDLLNFVNHATIEELNLSNEIIINIGKTRSYGEYTDFIFAKNIKIFGGINEYINNWFDKMYITNSQSILLILIKMNTYEYELTDKNKKRVKQNIDKFEQ